MPIEEALYSRAREALEKARGIRRPRVVDIFERVDYIGPDDVIVVNYLRKKPLAIFNPGAAYIDGEFWIFPRTVFEYFWYVSSIGLIKYGTGSPKPLRMEIVLWPREPWELAKGDEDPRVHIEGEYIHVLHTAVAPAEGGGIRPLQAYTVLDRSMRVVRRGFFRIGRNGEEYLPPSFKDSAMLEIRGGRLSMLLRPTIKGLEINWFGVASGYYIEADSMRPVMAFEEFESKVGWSTNAVKISSNEYLVGWHGVGGGDSVYRNGLAIVSSDGELLGVTDYLLEPRGLVEQYGDRPGVIFGCGLARVGEWLYWIGGMSDYAMGVFRTELAKALEAVKWLKY